MEKIPDLGKSLETVPSAQSTGFYYLQWTVMCIGIPLQCNLLYSRFSKSYSTMASC